MLVSHVLLAGVPMDMAPMAVLRLPHYHLASRPYRKHRSWYHLP